MYVGSADAAALDKDVDVAFLEGFNVKLCAACEIVPFKTATGTVEKLAGELRHTFVFLNSSQCFGSATVKPSN